jgi:murein DD-endopeptidase MepM/ murein hydrolase activator NlpD
MASTGADIERVLARLGVNPPDQGGPFIPFNPAKPQPQEDARRLEQLKQILKSLPLSAPLVEYRLESPFGARVDPLNHRQSFHPGLDMSAPYETPVFNTAPGIVTFTGYEGDYGKVVEIDHGMGISTRYAHLHRIMVARGQKLTGRQQIGQLGSSGRTTGPHVHYEVRINGVPQDPEKFLEAGKDVGKTVLQAKASAN